MTEQQPSPEPPRSPDGARPIKTFNVMSGAVFGFVANSLFSLFWMLVVVDMVRPSSVGGDRALTVAGTLLLPIGAAALLIPRRTREWAAGLVIGVAIGAMVGAGICGGLVVGL